MSTDGVVKDFDYLIGFCVEHGRTLRNHIAFGKMALELRGNISDIEEKLNTYQVENCELRKHVGRIESAYTDICERNNILNARVEELEVALKTASACNWASNPTAWNPYSPFQGIIEKLVGNPPYGEN